MCRSACNRPDGNDSTVQRIDIPGYDRLHLRNERTGRDHHIFCKVGICGMPALSFKFDYELRRIGKEQPAFRSDRSDREFRRDVQRCDHARLPLFKQVAFKHRLSAARSFLSRLEQKQQILFNRVADEMIDDAEGNRHVEIMPARMHPVLMNGRKRISGIFPNREPVHIRPVRQNLFRGRPFNLYKQSGSPLFNFNPSFRMLC
ncbi:hypothetical protein CHCC14437_3022 [Bacillus licheniformis]|nr:hypothetical protein CHCC14437_3022 [Bacillus licheniformis]